MSACLHHCYQYFFMMDKFTLPCTVAHVNIIVFCDVTLCSLIHRYHYFRRTYSLLRLLWRWNVCIIYHTTQNHIRQWLYTYAEILCFWCYRFRGLCKKLVDKKWFDNVILLFIALNCITLAMERPNIPPDSTERMFLSTANYIFTVVFAVEMFVKVQYHCNNCLLPKWYLRLYHHE